MTIQPTEYERPTWRNVNIDLLAQRMYSAYMQSNFHDAEVSLENNSRLIVKAWWRAAEAAVEMIVDEPEKEFQRQIDRVLSGEPNELLTLQPLESKAAREWREAKASDWIA